MDSLGFQPKEDYSIDQQLSSTKQFHHPIPQPAPIETPRSKVKKLHHLLIDIQKGKEKI